MSVSVSDSTISFLTTVNDEEEGDIDRDEADFAGGSSSVWLYGLFTGIGRGIGIGMGIKIGRGSISVGGGSNGRPGGGA